MAREKRIKEVRTGGGGKFLAFFLGILMGIIVIVGALGGVGYYVYKSPIKSTIEKIDGEKNGKLYQALFGNGDKAGFLDPSYADAKVGTLIKDTTKAVKALTNDGALSELDGISPKVREAVQKILKETDKFDAPLSEDDVMNQPVKDLKDYAVDQLKLTPMGGLLKGFNDGKETEDTLMLALSYGEEDVDYVYDENGEVVMINGAQKTTVQQLIEGGVDEQFNRITLEALGVDTSDPIMRTLAYGPASHYVLHEDNTVTMKQIVYTWDGTNLYDIDGKLAEGTFDQANKTLDTKDAFYYLDTQARGGGERITYYAYLDAGKERVAKYPKTKVSTLTEESDTLIDDLYLSDAMNINNASHQVLISLAYGSKDNYDVLPDGTIVPKEGFTPRTIGELKYENEEIINGIALGDAIGVTSDSHKVLIALAYGQKDIDYEIVGGEIKMKEGKSPKTLGDLSNDGESLINDITIADALDVTPASHRVLVSLAYGHEGENYDIVGGQIVPREGEDNAPRTLGSLSGEESESIINGIYLADALDITPESDKVLITLAYGKEGKDYKIEEGKFVMLGNSKPRALSDLSGDISPILDDITLADVMDPDYDSSLIMYLLYGREGIHYEITGTGEERQAVMLRQRIAVYNGKAYNPYGEEMVGVVDESAKTFTVTEGEGADAVVTVYDYVDLPSDVTPKTLTLTIEGVSYVAPYYFLELNGEPVYYEPTTIGELSGENNVISLLTKRLTIKEILGEESTQNNIFLQHVENETIDSLPEAIENLKFTDVYASDIFVRGTNPDGSKFYVDKDGNDVDVDGDGELSEEEKANRVVTSTWWYLLHNDAECHDSNCPDAAACTAYYDDDSTTVCTAPRRCQINSCRQAPAACHAEHCHLDTACPYQNGGECTELPDCARKGCIHDYKITEFDQLSINMTNNVQEATLLCLKLDEIVALDDSTLETELITEMSVDFDGNGSTDDPCDVKVEVQNVPKRANGNNKRYLQEMTISEILNYASSVLTAIDLFQTELNAAVSGGTP